MEYIVILLHCIVIFGSSSSLSFSRLVFPGLGNNIPRKFLLISLCVLKRKCSSENLFLFANYATKNFPRLKPCLYFHFEHFSRKFLFWEKSLWLGVSSTVPLEKEESFKMMNIYFPTAVNYFQDENR